MTGWLIYTNNGTALVRKQRTSLALYGSGGIITPPPPPTTTGTTIRSGDVTALPVSSPISTTNMQAFLGATVGTTAEFARTSVYTDPVVGKVLRQHLFPNAYGPSNGIGLNVPLSASFDELYMEFVVRHSGPTPWAAPGGKMPGLAGVNPTAGIQPPSGGAPTPQGFSARHMWVTPAIKPGYSNTPDELIGYQYTPIQASNTFGFDAKTNVSLVWNTWHTIRVYVKMNSVTVDGSSWNSDGIYRIWLDDTLVYETTNEVWRIYQAANATHFQWSIFPGGNTTAWNPSDDVYIDVRNYRIYTP